MNSKLLLISISIITLASCSTAYKTGQTPDDVYYSPVRYYGEEDNKKEEKNDEVQNRNYTEERQIRMSSYDRRWRDFDNDIYYNPYTYGYNYGYYYNPFYHPVPVYNTCTCACITPNPKTSTPRMTNLGGYGNGYNYSNTASTVTSKYGNVRSSTPTRTYNTSSRSSSTTSSGSKLGNTLNKVFNNSNNSSNTTESSNSSNNRTYSPSSSSSSSSSGSSSSSSGSSTSRPARSGKN